MADETTTIAIKLSTRDRLRKRGLMGEDYDSVIVKILDAFDLLNKSRKVEQ